MWIKGKSNIIQNNLVSLNIWSPTIKPLQSYAPINREYFGAIDISSSDLAIVENNFIAESQRVGLHLHGSNCVNIPGHSIKRNEMYDQEKKSKGIV